MDFLSDQGAVLFPVVPQGIPVHLPGCGISLQEAAAEDLYPDAEIEIIEGNQPHYQFVIAVE